LKRSNGSAHARQRHSALQGVEPKRLISSVSAESHCGQWTARDPAGVGGAIP
jgi:hypothetical protein